MHQYIVYVYAGAHLGGGIVPCPPFVTLPFSKKKTDGVKYLKYARLSDDFFSPWPGANPGDRKGPGIYILPLAISKSVLGVYNFTIISNLFDSNKPYALSTYNRKCGNKMHYIWISTQNQRQKIRTKFA